MRTFFSPRKMELEFGVAKAYLVLMNSHALEDSILMFLFPVVMF